MDRQLLWAGSALLLATFWISAGAAQALPAASAGSITGKVGDPTGAPIPGTQVTVTSESSRQRFVTSTNSSGTYTAPGLPDGSYTVSFEYRGFKTETKRSISVMPSHDTQLDIQLAVGTYSGPGMDVTPVLVPVITIDVPGNVSEITGPIFGAVTGPSGAPIAGAEVTFTSEISGREYRARTDSSGLYWYRALPVGSYRGRFTAPGFQEQSRTSVFVALSNTRLDIRIIAPHK